MRAGLVACLLLVGAGLFVNRALENSRRVNTDMGRTDQKAYINYAEAMVESDYAFVGARNRMPVFPYLLSTFRDQQETDEAFFEKAKIFSIGMTLTVVAILAVIFLLSFPLHTGLNLTFLSAFFVFLFRAAYVQAEVPYYLLSFLSFFVIWRLFAKPSWIWAVAGGLLLGVSHLTKASILPGVITFVVFYTADALWCAAKKRQWTFSIKRLAIVGVVLGVFLIAVFPYIKKSKEIYGHYFYNVNSTFYIWCDSWEEAKDRTRAFGDRSGWPDVPPDQIPSAANYFKAHTVSQVVDRIVRGSIDLNGIIARSYGYYPPLVIYAIFIGLMVIWRWQVCWRLFQRRPVPVLALSALFVGYFLLSAWYTQIISGNRIVLSLYLPLIFTFGVLVTMLARGKKIHLGSWRLPVLPLFNIAITCYLIVDIYLICTNRILRIYGGS